MIRGTFVSQARRCGKPTCRCTRGQLHPITVLSASVAGQTRNTYVPAADRARVQRLSQSYQSFRRARAELGRLAVRSVQIVDALQDLLTEPYPPSTKGGKTGARSRRKG